MAGCLHLSLWVLLFSTVLSQQLDLSGLEVRKRGLGDPDDPRNLFNVVYADYYKRRRSPREKQNERYGFVDETLPKYQPQPVKLYKKPEHLAYYKSEPPKYHQSQPAEIYKPEPYNKPNPYNRPEPYYNKPDPYNNAEPYYNKPEPYYNPEPVIYHGTGSGNLKEHNHLKLNKPQPFEHKLLPTKSHKQESAKYTTPYRDPFDTLEEDRDDYYYPLEPEEIEYTTPTPTTTTKVAPIRGLRDPYDPRNLFRAIYGYKR